MPTFIYVMLFLAVLAGGFNIYRVCILWQFMKETDARRQREIDNIRAKKARRVN